MKAGTFPRALFGRRTGALPLLAPVRVLAATVDNAGTLRCGRLIEHAPQALAKLGVRLAAAGHGDVGLQIRWRDSLAPAAFVHHIGDIPAPPKRPPNTRSKP